MAVEEINESLTAERYRIFSSLEAQDLSPEYTHLAMQIADDPDMLAHIDELPPSKRQAGYVFSAARFLDAPFDSYPAFREFVLDHWSEIYGISTERNMQTNDPARMLALLPLLATIEGPIALIEVGASAGMCLNADRYSYRWGTGPWLDPKDGPSIVRLECDVLGPLPAPTRMPDIVWRAGIEIEPIDLDSETDVRWLRALLWPDSDVRRRNVDAALEILREHPVRIVPGDLNDRLAEVVAEAPSDATLVVMHTAVMPYVSQEAAERFAATVLELDAVWISNELADVVPDVLETQATSEPFSFVVARDGIPVAHTHPHGAWVRWLQPEGFDGPESRIGLAS